MSRLLYSRSMLTCGLVLLVLVLGLALGAALPAVPARAQDLPPRPTRVPSPEPKGDDGDNARVPTAPGRITGTVIDQRTGAPAPGVSVAVGEAVVTSDANGNYDLSGLRPGSYGVALRLGEGQGQSAQSLAAGQAVVQHLFFRSPEPATPQAARAPEPVTEAAPTPAILPATGGAGQTLLVPMLVGLVSAWLGYALRRSGPRERDGTAS
jgi:Carboxypeptidase regulatory-like domain